MLPLLLAGVLALPGAPQDRQAESGRPPDRIRSVTVTGNEKCPESTAEEVVVCSRINAGDQFRIPTPLREVAPTAANQSWVNRAAAVDNVSRVAGGLPDTCSPVGSGGQTGCALQQNRAYAADRRARELEARSVPGGEVRIDETVADDEDD